MSRSTKNDRTHTFSNEALEKLDKIPRMERSKFVDKAVIAYPIEKNEREQGNIFTEAEEQRIKDIMKEVLDVYVLKSGNGKEYYIRKDDV